MLPEDHTEHIQKQKYNFLRDLNIIFIWEGMARTTSLTSAPVRGIDC